MKNDMSNSMVVRRVRDFVADQALLPPADAQGAPVVVGLSGGPDSVALAHVLRALGYDLLLTHCHFGLRGEEADRDLEFCRRLAAEWGVPLRVTHFDTYAYAREHRCSIEMACRELRYDWWQREFLLPSPEARLCVGHHADDSAETFLMNLMRGTGLRGLVGIPPRNGAVVRPLLCLTRAEILAYLDEQGLGYVTDSTNLETDYQRNKVRHLLLPLMEEVNGNARHGMAETMHHLREALRMAEVGYEHLVGRHVSVFERDGVVYQRLAREAFEVDFPAEGLVHAFLQDRAPMSRAMERDIARAVTVGRKNLTFGTQGAVVYLEASALVLKRQTGEVARPVFRMTELPQELSAELPQELSANQAAVAHADLAQVVAMAKENRNPERAFVDCDKVKLPLSWRPWRQGDRLRPLGMRSGSKLVSDLMSNAHLSPLQKEWTWVLEDAGGRIVWVSGLRVADDVKIDEGTRRVLFVEHVSLPEGS